MKTILAPVDPSISNTASLTTAKLVAARFGSTIDGVSLRPAFTEVMAPDPIVAVTLPPANWDETKFDRDARSAFEAGASGASVRWRGGASVDDGSLGSLARLYDVTVLPRPGSGGSRMTAFESALFDSGRPVMMAPKTPPKTLGDTIVVHWNRSSETARAVSLAMPILRLAKSVLVLHVEGAEVPGPTARDAAGHLIANGVPATDRVVVAGSMTPGEKILAECTAAGADLLIKGAYTQSRLRQMIFGGPTSHILAHADIPVFFAH